MKFEFFSVTVIQKGDENFATINEYVSVLWVDLFHHLEIKRYVFNTRRKSKIKP